MTTKNDITGDALVSKTSTDAYRDNWDRIFGKKPEHCQCEACKGGVLHFSDCAVHNEPARPNGKCDCGADNNAK